MELNEQQQRAALHKNGALVIVAGAGTGKTKTLTARIINLIASGVAPERILAVTFTNKAAHEMKERIAMHLPHNTAMPTVGTFHSFGLGILKKYGTRMGIEKNFTILDRDDQNKILEQGITALGLSTEDWSARKMRERISWLRNAGMTAPELAANAMNDLDRYCARVWEHYNNAKRTNNVLDFDDLLELPVRLLRTDEYVRTALQRSFDYIHIDEYQDTNAIQDELVEILAHDHGNVCVVGDTDQTIYTWRGAVIHNMLNFHKKFSNTELVTLTHNYRSSDIIVAAGNAVISKNKTRIPKDLIATSTSTETIDIYRAQSESDESLWVIEQLVQRNQNGVPWNDMCILYRSHHLSRSFEEACMRAGVPYAVIGTKFFDRKEIRDVMSWIRAAMNRKNLSDMKRVIDFPKRGIGAVAWAHICAENFDALKGNALAGWNAVNAILDSIAELIERNEPCSHIVLHAARSSGIYETLEHGDEEDHERLANIQELISYATPFDSDYADPREGFEAFMERIALLSDQDTLSDNTTEGAIKLMTIHAAKGLEFDTVAIIGLEDGVFPTHNDDALDKEEERRLMYVAITRARSKLILSWSMTRRIFGQTLIQSRSEFLADIPRELVSVTEEQPKKMGGLLDWDVPIVEWD